MLAAFFSQPNVDLILNTTANAAAGTVFRLCRAEPVPQPDSDHAIFWIVNATGFAAAVARKRGFGKTAAVAASWVLGPLAAADRVVRRRRPGPRVPGLDISVHDPETLGHDFDDLWERLLAERGEQLMADRSRGTMRWLFGATRASRGVVVAVSRAGRLAGAAVLTRDDAPAIGLRRLRVADLVVEHNEPALIDALLEASFARAHREGADVLELLGFPSAVRQRATAGRAYQRPLPAWPYWYRAVAPELRGALQHEGAWHLSAYDGDASI
jgi:hypothetical protein